MRFLISLVLFLTLQLAAVSQDILGTWSNPTATFDSDPYCCVPTSIIIDSDLKAAYQYSPFSRSGAKCGLFFGDSAGQGTVPVSKDPETGQYFIQKFESSHRNYKYIFRVKGNALTATGAGASSSATCSFSMKTKYRGIIVDYLIGFLVIVATAAIIAFIVRVYHSVLGISLFLTISNIFLQ